MCFYSNKDFCKDRTTEIIISVYAEKNIAIKECPLPLSLALYRGYAQLVLHGHGNGCWTVSYSLSNKVTAKVSWRNGTSLRMV